MTQQERQLKHGEVSFAIVRAFYDVYNELGFGFLEAVYREAMTGFSGHKGAQLLRNVLLRSIFVESL